MKKYQLWKRICALTLSGIMVAGIMTGCGQDGGKTPGSSQGGTSQEASEPGTGTDGTDAGTVVGRGGETLKFTYLRPVWGPATYTPGGEYEKALFEYANIDTEVQIIPVIEYDAKVKTIVAGGTLPDVMWAAGPGDNFWRELENQGAFQSIDELLDSHPTVKANIDETVMEQMRNPEDGKLYFLPRTIAADVPFFLYYRKDWFDAQNIAEPTTIEELNQALDTIKNAYPDVSPITVGMGGFSWMYKDLATSFGCTIGGWVASPEDPDKIVPSNITKEQEDFYFWLQDLRKNGWLDPEVGINPDANHGKQKFMAGKAAAYPGGYPDFIEISAALKKSDPDAVVGIMQPLTGPTGIKGGTRTSYPMDRGMYFSSEFGDIEGFFDFLEWWLTDGTTFRRYGVEGEMYNVVDGKIVTIPDDQRKEDYKATQIEPLSFFNLKEEELDFENTWKPSFESNGIADTYEYWYDSFMAYCENRFPDYLSPTVVSPTNVDIGAQIFESTLSGAEGSILLDTKGTREEWQKQVQAWLDQGGSKIIDEINAGQASKSKPTYGE